MSSGNGDIITQQYTTFADAQTYARSCSLGLGNRGGALSRLTISRVQINSCSQTAFSGCRVAYFCNVAL